LSQLRVPKAGADSINLADGGKLSSTHYVRTEFQIGELRDLETFHTAPLGTHDLILGMPWLARVAPRPNWRDGSLTVRSKTGEIVLRKRDAEEPAKARSATKQMDPEAHVSHAELVAALREPGAQMGVVYLHATTLEHPSAEPEPDGDERAAPTPGPKSAWQKQLDEVLDKYPVMAADAVLPFPPERGVSHTVKLTSDEQPRKRGYRISELERQALEEQLKDLLAKGWIRPSQSPYASPVIFVRKKDGSMRMCVDYRALNAITEKDRYPLPRIDELLDRLRGAKVFSKLDLASGYHQVRMDVDSIPKTAFQCERGLFEYTVMPFGLCNAPATFQSMMNQVLAGLAEFALVYLDDVLAFSQSDEEHLQHLDEVCQRLQKHQLYARRDKCEFGTRQTTFLGHVVSADGIACEPEKVEAVLQWPVPKSAAEVASFLGLVNFYRRFAKGLSGVAAPLTALLKKGAAFEWSEAAQEAFDAVKALLTSAPVLVPPDPNLPFVLECDASAFAVGAVLSQGEGTLKRAVAFLSMKLNSAQRNYLMHDKELLSVIHALQSWRHYLLNGLPIVVYTDSSATKYIST
jgi:hypothetical protein